MDYVILSSTPYDEPCVQVCSKRLYYPAMKHESLIYKRQLERLFPIPENLHCYFICKSFPHDFGTYIEVVIFFDDDDREAANFAYKVENEAPFHWDEIAKAQLLADPLIVDLYKQQGTSLPSSL